MSSATAGTKTERIMDLLRENPGLTTAEVAERIGCDFGTVQRARAKLESEPVQLPIADINRDFTKTQFRFDGDTEWEANLADLMKQGTKFDPVVVIRTPDNGLLIVDGWTRTGAALRNESETILAIVRQGTTDEAIRLAARANATHGRQRCRKTELNAVRAIIALDGHEHPVAHYAEQASVHRRIAKAALEQWIEEHGLARPAQVQASDGRMMPTSYKTKGEDGALYQWKSAPEGESANGNGVHHEPFDPETEYPATEEEDDGSLPERVVKVTREQLDDGRVKRKAEEDRAWLETLCRDAGKAPVRDLLPDHRRRVFDEDALVYRDIHQAGFWTAFSNLAVQLTGDKKADGGRGGNYARLVSWFRRLPHPRDWTLCSECKGKGCEAKGCNHRGYVIG